MAEPIVGALGVSATLSAAKFAAASGFTTRHEASLRAELSETDRSSEAFDRAYRSGDLAEEDWQTYLELKNDVVEKEEQYHQSLNDYKDTSVLNVVKKFRTRKKVWEAKRKVRDANQRVRSQYSSATSNASDASSIAAESGSPPGSGLEDERIREWAEDVIFDTPLAAAELEDVNFDTPLGAAELEDVVFDTPLAAAEFEDVAFDTPLAAAELEDIVFDTPLAAAELEDIVFDTPLAAAELEDVIFDTPLAAAGFEDLFVLETPFAAAEFEDVAFAAPSTAAEDVADATPSQPNEATPSPQRESLFGPHRTGRSRRRVTNMYEWRKATRSILEEEQLKEQDWEQDRER